MKQAIIIRKDLGMQCGKITAQACHASLTAAEKCRKEDLIRYNTWVDGGMKKIILKVNSEDELIKYFNIAKKMKVPCSIIRDAGLTQLEPGTATAVGIGPWDEREIDGITSKLKLL